MRAIPTDANYCTKLYRDVFPQPSSVCFLQPFLTLWNFFLLVTPKQEKTEYLWKTALAFILFVICSVLFPQPTYLFLSLSFCFSLLWFCCTFTNLIVYYPGKFGFKEAYSTVFYCDWFHHTLIQLVYQYKHNPSFTLEMLYR